MSWAGRPLRVLAVTHVFPRHVDDAAAPFLLRHLQNVAAAGIHVRVVAPHDAGLPARHVIGGLEVVRARYGSDDEETLAYRGEMHHLVRTPAGAANAVRLLAALRKAVAEEVERFTPDAIDVHWAVPSGFVVAGGRYRVAGRRVPFQVNVHGTDAALLAGSAATRQLARWILGRADAVTAMSEPLAAELTSLGHAPDHVTPMPPRLPPDSEPIGPAPADGPIVAIGRLVPEKGHLDLLEALAGVDDAPPLVLVGEGPSAAEIVERADVLGVQLDLRAAVPPAELDHVYRSARLVVVPSHREGFGLVAAEALAWRRPVVAARVGGLQAIVIDEANTQADLGTGAVAKADTGQVPGGPTGWLHTPRDVTDLRRAIQAALAAPTEADARAARGREHVLANWSPAALGATTAERLYALTAPVTGPTPT